MSESRSKKKFSRIIQCVLSGKKLKDFDAEKIREDGSESSCARDLIVDGLRYREEQRNRSTRNPFFEKDR